MAYDAKAQEFAYGFYGRGWSKERALREIRKSYPGFSGSTWDEWVEKLDWRGRRAAADAKLREFDDLVRDSDRAMLLELDELRKNAWKAVNVEKPDPQATYAYLRVVKAIADLCRHQLASRDGGKVVLEVLNAAFERFVTVLREDPELAELLAKKAALVGRAVEKVAEEFGAEA